MNGGGGGGGSEGDFGFLDGFEAWGAELGGTGSGQGGAGGGGTVHSPGNGVSTRAPPGIGSMTGLGGSMQSFLGEAGLLQESSGGGSGAESVGGDNSNSCTNSNSNSCGSRRTTRRRAAVADGSGLGGFNGLCKTEPVDEGRDDDEEDDDDSEGEYDDLDYHRNKSARRSNGGRSSSGASAAGGKKQQQQQQQQQQGSLRGLGRIFGMGAHPVVAEAQSRAEAIVHGRGVRSGGGGGGGGGGAGGTSSAAEAAEKKRKRAVLSKEERAKQNRDRNREHARNTRLRKKAFVEELKKQVEDLVAGREREEAARRQEARRVASLREIRLQALLTFLEYRGRCEMGRKEWQSVLDDSFEMRMPITPYRSFPPQQVQGGMRVIKGLDSVIADTLSLSMATKGNSSSAKTPSRLEDASQNLPAQAGRKGKGKSKASSRSKRNSPTPASVSSATAAAVAGDGLSLSSSTRGGATSSESCSGTEGDSAAAAAAAAAGPKGKANAAAVAGVVSSPNRVYYVVDPKEVMALNQAFMCPFLVRSPQLLVPGMLKATFSPKSNRLCSLNLSFDPTVPARQLARAAMLQGRATPGMAGMMAGMLGMGGVDVSSLVGAKGVPPHPARSRILPAAAPSSALVGQDEGVLHSVLQDIREWRVSSTVVDDPVDTQVKSYLRVYPLSGDTPGVTHFIGVLENLNASMANQAAQDAAAAENVEAGSSGSGTSSAVTTPIAAIAGGEQLSSGLEAGVSEGETSLSDSSSTLKGRGRGGGVTFHESGGGSGSASGSSGSGGSDDGSASRQHGHGVARSSRLISATSGGTTTASDGGYSNSGGSGCETRRTRRGGATGAGGSGGGSGSSRVPRRGGRV